MTHLPIVRMMNDIQTLLIHVELCIGKALMALPGGVIREEPSLKLPGKHHVPY